MIDPTELARRLMIATDMPAADLAVTTGSTWDTEALKADFEVIGFLSPYVAVRRRSDGVVGSLEFTHSPRLYFGWEPDE